LSAESDGTEQCLTFEKEPDGNVLLAVFDGMGGGDYGEVASYEAAAAAAAFCAARLPTPTPFRLISHGSAKK